jgi:hypothetical protein
LNSFPSTINEFLKKFPDNFCDSFFHFCSPQQNVRPIF